MSDLAGLTQNEELGCLARSNGGGWERRILRFGEENLAFLDADSFCLEWNVPPDCCFSMKRTSEKIIVIKACPMKNGIRYFMSFEVELDKKENVQKLIDFMTDANYIPAKTKKILVLINPASGKGKAPQIWKQVAQMAASSDTEYEVILTKRAGHAKEILQNLDVDEYGGVVSVSGDGGLWEIANGLYAREDWLLISKKFPLGLVPGGSGHAMHCSLMFHQKEPFDQEYSVAALNVARRREMEYDYLECSTETSSFVSLFGIAWGVIPEVDVGSEFIRFLGPSRGKLLAIWRWCFPRFHSGTVHFQPYGDPEHSKMPDIKDPVPSSWKTIEGPFLNVYACKQPWLDYEMFFCPDAKPDDGVLWLVVIMATISRRDCMHWMLNGEDSGHLASKHTLIFPIRAFRFVPLEAASAPMTVDAELLAGGVVQGVIRQTGVRIMVK